jgi:carboxymethylenebutenolidase
MGQMVDFASNGGTASGYLATPPSGSGPGVLVLQEWWGLVPWIKQQADRLAAEGFVALAPDLYHGEMAQHDEMDKAGHLMQSLPMDRAARDMQGAVDHLLGLDAVTGEAVGAVGYCMGGMLALVIAANAGAKVGAVVPHYGAPLGDGAPDWSNLQAKVLGFYAEKDDFFPPDAIAALESELRGMGKDVTFTVVPGTGHAFCNEENALGTYDAAAADRAWTEGVAFLEQTLG